jgi:hypothetical protein
MQSSTMLLSCVAEANLARADACQTQSSQSRLQKAAVIDFQRFVQKHSGGNDGLMDGPVMMSERNRKLPQSPFSRKSRRYLSD